MKTSRAIAFFLVFMALLMTGAGGLMDMLTGSRGSASGLYISREHAWNDGQFLILLAIFLVLAF